MSLVDFAFKMLLDNKLKWLITVAGVACLVTRVLVGIFLGFGRNGGNVSLSRSQKPCLRVDESTELQVPDVGGIHVRLNPGSRRQPIKIDSAPAVTPKKMIEAVRAALEGGRYDVVPHL